MKKMLLSLLAIAFLAGTAPVAWAETTPTPTPKPKREINLACMQAAVSKRDSALISTVDAYHTSAVAALKARHDSLKTAWGKTDKKTRRTDIATAWKTYRVSSRAARHAFRASKKKAWETFRTERKACGTLATLDDATNEAVDIDL